MRTIQVRNARSGAPLGQRIDVADRWWRRAVGLLGHAGLPTGRGILLVPCASVHTFGMRFAIDVAFLDEDDRVVMTRPALPPGRWAVGGGKAHATLELPAGTLASTDTRAGDFLTRTDTIS